MFICIFIILLVIESMFIMFMSLLIEFISEPLLLFDDMGGLGGLWLIFSKGLCTGVLRKLKRLVGLSKPMINDELQLEMFVVAFTTSSSSGPSGVGDIMSPPKFDN